VREGRLAAEVRSANVVKVAALGRLPHGPPYLVMEYVEGPTLDALLEGRDLVTCAAVDCGRQLCLALEAAHEQGLVHGDVSLRNIFATPQPDGSLHMQLGDFGLARRIRRRPNATTSVEVGGGRGTPRFMAPEVISGEEADERSEIFAVGVVLYRLLTGRYPFDGESVREILTATLRGGPVPLAQHRTSVRALEPVVMRCLAPEPAERFPSARALREALESARAMGSESRGHQDRARRAAAGVRRAVLVTLAVAASAAAVWVGVHAFREHARIPLTAALQCPDTVVTPADGDADLAHAVAQAACARVGAALDLDWGGGPDATRIQTRLHREAGGSYRLDLEVLGRVETARGGTPFAAAAEAAGRLLARAVRPPMSPAEIRYWGATDAESAAAARAVWRRRTSLVIGDYEQEPRAALVRDPGLPLVHLLLAEVERDPARRREAQAQALAHADRLPPERAAALRAAIAVQQNPEDVAAALEQLRHAYTSSPGDLDIGVLYAGALVSAGRTETALAVAERMHSRFPRRAALALHYASLLPERTPDAHARQVAWLVEALPEARGLTDDICLLAGSGRLTEADAALAFARRLGVPEEGLAIPATVLALAVGDPARIERETLASEGTTRSWSQLVGARLRLAGLLLRGQVAAAETFLLAQIAGRRAADDEPSALQYAVEQLRLTRLAGGPPLGRADLDWMEQRLAQAKLPLATFAAASTELLLARAAAGEWSPREAPREAARRELAELDGEIARRAGADALALAAAQLRTVPLVRFALGDAQAAARWRAASAAWLEDRVRVAFDAALALAGSGNAGEAESAYRLAASPYDIDRHPLESIAARVRLADLLAAQSRAAEAQALRDRVDLAWSGADPGLRERVRRSAP
jgi:hypothetical protein